MKTNTLLALALAATALLAAQLGYALRQSRLNEYAADVQAARLALANDALRHAWANEKAKSETMTLAELSADPARLWRLKPSQKLNQGGSAGTAITNLPDSLVAPYVRPQTPQGGAK